MAVPSSVPEVYVRIERGGRHRLMFLSPPASDAVTGIQAYAAPHLASAGGLVAQGSPMTITPDPGEILELVYSPGTMGVYAFAFVNADGEGEVSPVATFVYGSALALQSILSTSCLEGLSTGLSILNLLADTSAEVEMHTRQKFYPFFQTKTIDGPQANELKFDEPIVQVSRVALRSECAGLSIIDPGRYRVYNRHMLARMAYDPKVSRFRVDGTLVYPGDGTGGQLNPDDRFSPRIALATNNQVMRGRPSNWSSIRASAWPMVPNTGSPGVPWGGQNVVVDGFWGFVEGDGSTPVGIQIATELLARRQAVIRFGDDDEALTRSRAHLVYMEKTVDNTIMYQPLAASGPGASSFTGDPEIDKYLLRYVPAIGVETV